MHQEVATRNAQNAVKKVNQVEATVTERLNQLERLAVTQQQRLDDIERKYNLLLTKNFNGGSTT